MERKLQETERGVDGKRKRRSEKERQTNKEERG